MRLLDPSIFGKVGQALAFVGFSQILIDSGFGWALIQKKEIDDDYLSTVFWTNIGLGIVLFAFFYLLAPNIENFYETEGLTLIIRVLSFGFIIASLNVVQRTIYQRNIDFKRLSIINVSSFGCANVVAIIMAFYGWGVWSLVSMYLLNFSFAAILLWIYTSFKPTFQFNFQKLKELFGFSTNVLGLQTLNFFARKSDKILIGKYVGDQALGIYENTYLLFVKSIAGLSGVFQKVLFPAFSRIQDQREKISKYLLSFLDLISIFIFPLLVIGHFLAEPIVLTLFGEKWIAMVFIFKVFCFVSFFLALNPVITSILLAIDKSKLVLNLNLFSKFCLFSAFLIGVKWGINGVAIGYLVATTFNFFFKVYFSGKALNIPYFTFLKSICRNALFAIILGLILNAILHCGLFSEGHLVQLIAGITIGGAMFLILLYTMKKKELIVLFNNIKNRNA